MRSANSRLSPPHPISDTHDLTVFDCGVSALNLWLVRHALTATQRRAANTFVVCRGSVVVGYYSLANGAIAHSGTSANVKRNTPDPIPATILARLAVDVRDKGQGLGRDLLIDACRIVMIATRFTAARLLVVHPLDESASAFYTKYGFKKLGGDTTALYQPVATLADGL